MSALNCLQLFTQEARGNPISQVPFGYSHAHAEAHLYKRPAARLSPPLAPETTGAGDPSGESDQSIDYHATGIIGCNLCESLLAKVTPRRGVTGTESSHTGVNACVATGVFVPRALLGLTNDFASALRQDASTQYACRQPYLLQAPHIRTACLIKLSINL